MSETPDVIEQTPISAAPPTRPGRWARRLKRFGIAATLLLVLVSIGGVGSEYYTSRPEFCGTCHIMQPYYKSWQNDVHSGDAYAACVDCHYAPGQHHTLTAKFRGLSQAMSYFSGRAGAGRPKAHVNDASCLTSGCHGNLEFMTAEVMIGNVSFSHALHLDPEGENLLEKQNDLAEMRKRLLRSLSSDQLAAVEKLARSLRHATARAQRLAEWLEHHELLALRNEVLAYAELLHAEVRVHQLSGLKCASCHQFDHDEQQHFTVARTTCYTCHFINQPFNANTGECLGCHEPPTGPVPIHPPSPSTSPAPAGVTMDHATIIVNNVDCMSCHADLIRGTGQVTRRDCQNCHDQERYVEDFDGLTSGVVRDYHRIHAAKQHARCNDCHELIQHELTPVPDPSQAAALLSPVRQGCQHCHPDHHREQVELLLGRGGFPEDDAQTPNPMVGLRASCRACHTRAGVDPKGDAVITGTMESCRGCHSDDYQELFARWQQSIEARLEESQALLTDVEQRLAAITSAPGQVRSEAQRLAKRARRNIQLVVTANGIHNKNYALVLLDQSIVDLEKALKLLSQ